MPRRGRAARAFSPRSKKGCHSSGGLTPSTIHTPPRLPSRLAVFLAQQLLVDFADAGLVDGGDGQDALRHGIEGEVAGSGLGLQLTADRRLAGFLLAAGLGHNQG